MLEPLFSKVTGLHPATLQKKDLCHWCFPVNFSKFLTNLLQSSLVIFEIGLLKNFSISFQIRFKFISSSLQICYEFASEFALFVCLFLKFPSIRLKKMFTSSNPFQIRLKRGLIRFKMKRNLETILYCLKS